MDRIYTQAETQIQVHVKIIVQNQAIFLAFVQKLQRFSEKELYDHFADPVSPWKETLEVNVENSISWENIRVHTLNLEMIN